MIISLVVSIVTFSILTTVVENMFSDSVYRKYISQFTGILFVIMLINPVLNIFSKVDTDEVLNKWKMFFSVDEYRLDSKLWEEEYANATKKEFEALLENNLSALLGDLCEIKKCEVTFAGEDKDNYSGIEMLKLSVGPIDKLKENDENEKHDEKGVGKVENIDIKAVLVDEPKKTEDKSDSRGYKEMISEIKRRISDYLSLKEDDIIIDYV